MKSDKSGTDSAASEPTAPVGTADALVHLAAATVGNGLKRPARSGAQTEMETEGMRCHIADGPALAAATAQRLACDSGVVLVVEDADTIASTWDGNPLDLAYAVASYMST